MAETGAVIGLRGSKGGAVAVGLVRTENGPSLLFSTLLATSAEGDRLAFEPFAVAAEMSRDRPGVSAEAVAAVAEGRRRQEHYAQRGLRALADRLVGAGAGPVAAALLVNRAGWIADLLEYSLGWPEHVPVAEGLAVREALRAACASCAIALAELDEKSLSPVAAQRLGLPAEVIDVRLKQWGIVAGKPWRREQKLACLAAWIALDGAG